MTHRRFQILFLLALILSAPALAAVSPSGNVSNYTGTISVNIPITMEDTAYPPAMFYFFAVFGFVMIGLGIVFIADSTNVPSISIVACGLLAAGCFLICAMSAPYIADSYVSVQSGSVTSVNNYIFSPWVGLAMWGGFVAGIVVTILGTLSFFGMLSRFGIGSAQKGDYLELDGQQNPEDRFGMPEGNYKRIGKGKAK
jgi:hypothetical protein